MDYTIWKKTIESIGDELKQCIGDSGKANFQMNLWV